ncbi:MAG: hypothetical protein LBO00_02670 [Zoogloeaceae bacterium]|jgi:predicted DNA-binding transcriptional regulator AlpA|nr:hypothetical protein [Zoogloeaceae bacterium]
MTDDNDRVIMRPALRKLLDVSSETIRMWIKMGKLPPPDVNISRRVQGWRVSTLRAHGINIA